MPRQTNEELGEEKAEVRVTAYLYTAEGAALDAYQTSLKTTSQSHAARRALLKGLEVLGFLQTEVTDAQNI